MSKAPLTGISVLLLAYQSSHPGMTEMGENTALQQSTTNDRVSNEICYFHMNLYNDGIKKTQKKKREFKALLPFS